MSDPPRRPAALMLSAGLGVVGVLLFAIGSVTGVEAVFVAGAAAGALSLGAALYWRSELISAWRQDRPRRSGPLR